MFGATYDEHPEEWSQIFDVESSDKAYEERLQQKGFGLAPVKSQGFSVSFEDTSQGYVARITNVTYGLGAIITMEALDDGLYEPLAMRIAKYLAFSIRQTEENVGANIINRATTAGYTGGDGVVLATASHPESTGNQSNLLSPAADFSETALEDMLIMIMNATDSKGLKISLIGQKLIVPTALTFEAERVLKSALQSGGANNDINAIKSLGLLPGGISANHYLTDSDAWGIKTNAQEGLIAQNRKAAKFTKDNEFTTENAMFKSVRRIGFGWGDWRGYYHSAGA